MCQGIASIQVPFEGGDDMDKFLRLKGSGYCQVHSSSKGPRCWNNQAEKNTFADNILETNQ